MLDLDGFKAVKDGFGHDVGDRLLVQVSRRLRDVLRPGDVLARFGGDEFVAAVDGMPDAASAHEFARRMLEALEAPFVVDAHELAIGVTIGFALAPDDGADPTALQRLADAAMYAGKASGGRTVRRATSDGKRLSPRSATAVRA